VALDVHLVTPEREVWAGLAEEVVARGVDGDVGILNGHAPIMVQLAIGPLRIVRGEDQEDVWAVVDTGFMNVTSAGDGTRVDVLAAHAETTDQIDLEAARRRAEEMERRLENHNDGVAEAELAIARAELKKALTRITLAG
jgi:F-type H+-transporting ATPase subunit epsilon